MGNVLMTKVSQWALEQGANTEVLAKWQAHWEAILPSYDQVSWDDQSSYDDSVPAWMGIASLLGHAVAQDSVHGGDGPRNILEVIYLQNSVSLFDSYGAVNYEATLDPRQPWIVDGFRYCTGKQKFRVAKSNIYWDLTTTTGTPVVHGVIWPGRWCKYTKKYICSALEVGQIDESVVLPGRIDRLYWLDQYAGQFELRTKHAMSDNLKAAIEGSELQNLKKVFCK